MKIDTSYFARCIETLARAHQLLACADESSIEYDMYRSACIKEFEIILEQGGKLLRRVLKEYEHSGRSVDAWTFKEVFRQAVLRSLLDANACERWLEYRDNRNHTAHDYGVNFAQATLVLLPNFIRDAGVLEQVIREKYADS